MNEELFTIIEQLNAEISDLKQKTISNTEKLEKELKNALKLQNENIETIGGKVDEFLSRQESLSVPISEESEQTFRGFENENKKIAVYIKNLISQLPQEIRVKREKEVNLTPGTRKFLVYFFSLSFVCVVALGIWASSVFIDSRQNAKDKAEIMKGLKYQGLYKRVKQDAEGWYYLDFEIEGKGGAISYVNYRILDKKKGIVRVYLGNDN